MQCRVVGGWNQTGQMVENIDGGRWWLEEGEGMAGEMAVYFSFIYIAIKW